MFVMCRLVLNTSLRSLRYAASHKYFFCILIGLNLNLYANAWKDFMLVI